MRIIYTLLAILAMVSISLSQVWSSCELSKKMENQCASYCHQVLKPLLQMAAECRKRDVLVLELQRQLEELRINMAIVETSLKEKEIQCKLRIDHAREISRMSNIPQNVDTRSPSNCADINESSGIHMIQIPTMGTLSVRCDSHIAGLGWTVIQSRLDGSTNFNRSWTEYRNGFGDVRSEFFIGLEKLHMLTSIERHELYIFMKDQNLQHRSARYDDFKVGSEQTGYKLISIGNHTGYSDDVLRENLQMQFTTFDRDHDTCENSNCAVDLHGGWWYRCCSDSNLNGGYNEQVESRRIFWHYSADKLITVHMLIRPKRPNLC